MVPLHRVRTTLALAGLVVAMAAEGAGQLTAQHVVHGGGRSAVSDLPLLERPARLEIQGVALEAALLALTEASGVPLAFSPARLPRAARASCSCVDLTLREALDLLLEGIPLRYSESAGQVVLHPLDEWRAAPRPVPIFTRNAAVAVGDVSTGLALPARVGLAAVRQGTIAGQVVQTLTLRPLVGAQVSLPGTGIGGLANNDGRFLLVGVPAGEHRLRVEMIGYATEERTVLVREGQTTSADFQLEARALGLDEIVVTGTAGGQQRRAIGNAVDRVDATRIMETAPVLSVQQLMGSRMAGVVISAPVAQVGGGSSVRIRGDASLSLSGEPIVYIDGVRTNSSTGGPQVRGGRNISRMNDLNPEDIERIEVIKGPAAATLYGTEASNGVIQIITKRGRPGAMRFDLGYKIGANWMQDPAKRVGLSYYTNANGEIESFNLYEHEREFGRGDVFSTGLAHFMNGSVSGGSDQIRYFVSADYADETGIVPENWNKKFTGRMNLGLTPTPTLSINSSIGYAKQSTRQIQGEIATDVFSQLVWGSPVSRNTPQRGFLFAPPEVLAIPENLGSVDRITGSLEIRFKPLPWLDQRLVGGIDVGEEEDSKLFPRTPEGETNWFSARGLGDKTINRAHVTFATLDYAGTASYSFTDALRASTSFGFQYYRRASRSLVVLGSLFPAPPVTTVDGAATTQGSETFTENATVGMYVQQQFEWDNRAFVTVAVRGDDNSAFGTNYDAAIYPKFSATWVAIEQEPMGPLSQLKLRAAWGKAGQQPGANAAVRLYAPITGPGGTSGVTPGAFGNPDLKPEVGVELEVGFDAALFGDRVNLMATRYSRVTRDAIVQNPLAPSSGFSGSQSVNVGEVKGWGTELAVDARVLDRERVGIDVGATYANMGSEVVSLGGIELASTWEGYPLGMFVSRRVVSADLVNGQAVNVLCDGGTGPGGRRFGGEPVPCGQAPQLFWGQTQPAWQASVNSTVTLYGRLRLFANIEALGGNVRSESTVPAGHTSYCMTLACQLRDDPVFLAYLLVGRNPTGFYKAGFAKLREVSATYNLPPVLASRIGASGASVSVAGRNLATLWLENEKGLELPYGGNIWDPEFGGQTVLPPMANVLVSFRVTF